MSLSRKYGSETSGPSREGNGTGERTPASTTIEDLLNYPPQRTDEENYSPVIATAVVLDKSGSVQSQSRAIDDAGNGAIAYIKNDPVGAAMVRWSTVLIADPVQAMECRPIGECEIPTGNFGSSSPIWEAHGIALDMLEKEQKRCRETGRPFRNAILLSVTDWRPNPDDRPGNVLERIHTRENDEDFRLNFFPVVVGDNPDMELANRVSSKRKAAVLKDLNYKALFVWFSQLVSRHARSRRGEEVNHPRPDWMTGQ